MRTEGWPRWMMMAVAGSIIPGIRAALAEKLAVEEGRFRLAAVAGSPLPEWVEDEIGRRHKTTVEYGRRSVYRCLTSAEVVDTVHRDVCSGDLSPPISYPRDVS